MFFYDDKRTGDFNPAIARRLDPTAAYLRHYDNMLFLQFILNRSEDRTERHQANKEMTICQRKLDYWARSYDHSRALIGMDALKKRWRSGENIG